MAITSDGPGRLGSLNGAEPDRAHAEDRHGLAVGERPRVDRMEASAHHVACEEGDIVGDPLRDLPQGEVRVGHQNLLRLGALQRAERCAVPVDTGLIALVELLALAEEAFAARRPVGPEHPIADRHPRHIVPGGDHLADELVADHEARLDLDTPVVDVEIRAADPARLDADDGVVRREQLRLGDLVELNLAWGLKGDRAHT